MSLDAQMDFLDFVAARHQAWAARQAGLPQPWTDDPIVSSRKFTNVFRVLDYGSQFVLTDLIEDGLEPEDQLMRLFLYRHTGRVEVWKYLQAQMGGYPTCEDLDDVLEVFKEYRGEAKIRTRSVFTSAYLVFPQSQIPGTDKLDSIIDLTKRLFVTGTRTSHDFFNARNQMERFESLRRNKGVADFMSMQILTDWGYGTEFREDDFVVAGPGARKGAAALGLRPEEAVRWAVTSIRSSLPEVRVAGRVPSYMDAQNCLCEFSKYVRYQQKPNPSEMYRPAHPGPQTIVLPKHW